MGRVPRRSTSSIAGSRCDGLVLPAAPEPVAERGERPHRDDRAVAQDPEFATDPRCAGIRTLTLSYTFFRVDGAPENAAAARAALDAAAARDVAAAADAEEAQQAAAARPAAAATG